MSKAASSQITVTGGRSFNGFCKVPGDKSISHRALMIAAFAERPCEIRGLSDGADVAHTLSALSALGARSTPLSKNALRISGNIRGTSEVIYLGNSGTGIRLLAGIVAGFNFTTTLDGDASIRRRPMGRVMHPLAAMGAFVAGSGPDASLAPLVVHGGNLQGIDYVLPVASAQVKSAVLLAALRAKSPTTITEPQLSRTHTEEMLLAAGAKLKRTGNVIKIWPGALDPPDMNVAGDPSQAAFWLVAACLAPDSEVTTEGVYLGPARCGFVEILQRMGADIIADPITGNIQARSSQLTGTQVTSAELPGCIDEVPILALAAAVAHGVTIFEGIAELRYKETDRVAAIGDLLTALGVEHRITQERLEILGLGSTESLQSATIHSRGDHRMAMAAAIAGAVGLGSTTVQGFDATVTSYPGFADDLVALTGSAIDVAATSTDNFKSPQNPDGVAR